MRFRQVHLDFHTSGLIPDIGGRFSKEQFQKALKLGHVDSITVFSKCHHGWAYHPSTANTMHPNLTFDLLGAELEACREKAGDAWDDEEYYVVFDAVRADFPGAAFEKLSPCAGLLTLGGDASSISAPRPAERDNA